MSGPTLVVLAAGIGSRYGGVKQLEGFGSNGETLLDYAVFDALRAGFSDVVFMNIMSGFHPVGLILSLSIRTKTMRE